MLNERFFREYFERGWRTLLDSVFRKILLATFVFASTVCTGAEADTPTRTPTVESAFTRAALGMRCLSIHLHALDNRHR